MATFNIYELVSLINQEKIDLFDQIVANGGADFKSSILTIYEKELESRLKEPAGSSDNIQDRKKRLAFGEGSSKSASTEPAGSSDKIEDSKKSLAFGEGSSKSASKETAGSSDNIQDSEKSLAFGGEGSSKNASKGAPAPPGKLTTVFSRFRKSKKEAKPWHKQAVYEIRGRGDVFQILEGSPVGDLGFENVVDTYPDIEAEIDLLKKLPPQFNVRTWDNRKNLFQAATLGPEGTVFDSALFLFNVKLPETYPNDPPIVKYIGGNVLGEMVKGCGGLLMEEYVKSTWLPRKKLDQLLLGIQGGGGGFFDENLMGTRKEGQLLSWNIMLETVRQPSPYLAKEIITHYNTIFPILTFRFKEALEVEKKKTDEYRRIELIRNDLESNILKASWEHVTVKKEGLMDKVTKFFQGKEEGINLTEGFATVFI